MAKGLKDYAPFRDGVVERGREEKCPICGIAKANQHSLRESAACDWKHPRNKARRAKAEQEKAA